MKNGWLDKYDANAHRLDDEELAQLAADMKVGGFDANDDQWEKLNQAVDALPPEEQETGLGSGQVPRPQPSNDVERTGVAQNQRLVSGDRPGSGSNPIGYPGTDQDQERPGQGKKTVPGMKSTDDKGT